MKENNAGDVPYHEFQCRLNWEVLSPVIKLAVSPSFFGVLVSGKNFI